MKKVSLLFGIHMHQPVDNFDCAVEKAIDKAYMPFFETMVKYPEFHFSLHCSGWLLQKIIVEYPKLFTLMQELTEKGSIEWLSGAFYEPILTSISSCDRKKQIEKLSNFIFTNFGQKPKGLWLAERVWDASLVKDIKEVGLEYVMVDDYHLRSNGLIGDNLNGYYETEESAERLALFPISKDLRYALPFLEVDQAIEKIISGKDEESSAAIMFDDAEKFGLWPKTDEWVYTKEWLVKFVETLLKNPQITTKHYSTYKEENRSLGLVYLDNASYEEMGEWSLELSQLKTFKKLQEHQGSYTLKGGIWKNFFIKYSESNYLHKRMLALSKEQESFDEAMLDSLYRLQTNDVFWHGAFGGLYLPSLRDNAYKYLLEIEAKKSKKKLTYERKDIDLDGYDELKVTTSALSMVISCKNGAQVVEFGSLESLFNWQNTLMRREEIYHYSHEEKSSPNNESGIATIHQQEESLSDAMRDELIFDWHAKNSFIEHYAKEAFTLENFKQLTFQELGDFANQPFYLKKRKFRREGGIYLDGEKYDASLQKRYKFSNKRVSLKSKFSTQYREVLYFAQEFNLHFAHSQQVTFNGEPIENGWSAIGIDSITIVDDFTKKRLILKTEQKCNVFAIPLKTVSKSENGFESIVQQISFIFTLDFVEKLNFKISMEVKNV